MAAVSGGRGLPWKLVETMQLALRLMETQQLMEEVSGPIRKVWKLQMDLGWFSEEPLQDKVWVPAGIHGLLDGRSLVSPCSQSKSSSLDWTSGQSED